MLVENKSGEIEVHDLTDSSQPVRAWAPVGSLLRAAYFAREGGRAVIIDRRTTQARLTWLQSGASGGIEETVVDSIHPVPRRVMMDLGDSGAFAIYFTAIWRDHLYAVDRSGNQGRAITGKLQNVTALRLVAGDTKAVVVTRRKDLTRQGLELWDLASTNRVRKIYLDYHVTDIRPNIGGTLIALVGASRELRIVDADSFETRHEFRAHDQRISTAAFHPNQSIIATGSADLTVKLWDYRTGRLLKQFLGFGLEVFHLAFSPDGKLLLASSMDKTTRVWSVEDLAVEP